MSSVAARLAAFFFSFLALAFATSSAVGARPSFVVSFAMSFFEPMVRTCSLLVAPWNGFFGTLRRNLLWLL